MMVPDTDSGADREVAGGPDHPPYPTRLRGGYHDGARLIGVDDRTAVYYNRVGRSLIRYRYDPDDELFHAEQGSEEPLPARTSIGTYLRERHDEFSVLSSWGRLVLGDVGTV